MLELNRKEFLLQRDEFNRFLQQSETQTIVKQIMVNLNDFYYGHDQLANSDLIQSMDEFLGLAMRQGVGNSAIHFLESLEHPFLAKGLNNGTN